ncbi:hypothetical protein LJE82_12640, partial [bacterium BMS3Abin03]|nr:hypothetical protein [bacterium BMS3Abin03]
FNYRLLKGRTSTLTGKKFNLVYSRRSEHNYFCGTICKNLFNKTSKVFRSKIVMILLIRY